jgi:ferric-dicitrate binding protein FerR (iron transport regulator)
MRIPDQLVEKFLSGQATDDEARLVAAYLKENPEKLDQYMTDKSWEGFDADIPHEVPTDRMRAFLEARVGKPRVVPMKRIAIMAAASIALIAGAAALWHGAAKTTPAPVIATITAPQIPAPEINTPGLHTLPDGSKVKLAKNTTVTYNGRDITLTGDAIFTVHQDKTRPFTVHAGGVSTTALGTVFEVDDRKDVRVHLFSGKVVVRKEGAKDLYLTPGQTAIASGKMRVIDNTKFAPADVQTLAFDNQSLATIFDILKKTYNVPIRYNHATMKNFQFTGAFNRDSETLESILNTVCSLNDLKAVKGADGGFAIRTQ